MPAPQVAFAAVNFKVIYSLFVVAPIGCVLFWYLVLWCGSWCPIYFGNHLAEEEIAGRFA